MLAHVVGVVAAAAVYPRSARPVVTYRLKLQLYLAIEVAVVVAVAVVAVVDMAMSAAFAPTCLALMVRGLTAGVESQVLFSPKCCPLTVAAVAMTLTAAAVAMMLTAAAVAMVLTNSAGAMAATVAVSAQLVIAALVQEVC
jgi:hypothetical protein